MASNLNSQEVQQDKLANPTFILGILSFVCGFFLLVKFRRKTKELKCNVDTVFGLELDALYRQLLLVRYIKYMTAFYMLFSIWVMINWGSIVLYGSYKFQNSTLRCEIAAVLFGCSWNGGTLLFILVLITALGYAGVGFNWRCCRGRLSDYLYPLMIESSQQCETVFRCQFGSAMALLFILVLIPFIPFHRPIHYGANGNEIHSQNMIITEEECWVRGYYELVAYIPILIALVVSALAVLYVWHQRNWRCRIHQFQMINRIGVGLALAWRITGFVVIFWVSFGWETLLRVFVELAFGKKHTSLAVLCAHHYLMAMVGFWNCVAWYWYDPMPAHVHNENEIESVSQRNAGVDMVVISTAGDATHGYGSCDEAKE